MILNKRNLAFPLFVLFLLGCYEVGHYRTASAQCDPTTDPYCDPCAAGVCNDYCPGLCQTDPPPCNPCDAYCDPFCQLATPQAAAETVTTVRSNGPSWNRVDIAIFAEGYRQDQMGKFERDVESMISKWFATEEPFRTYASYINIHRVNTISNQDGADHPAQGITRDTRFNARFGNPAAGETERLLRIDYSLVEGAANVLLQRDMADILLVLVNDPQHGGSASGRVAITTMPDWYWDNALHEIAHLPVFSFLSDEYLEYGRQCDPLSVPNRANFYLPVSSQFPPTKFDLPWSHWVEYGTPVPTDNTQYGTMFGVVGAYQYAAQCLNAYRPTFGSKMRLQGRPFEQVNTEAIVIAMYRTVNLIEYSSSSPAVNAANEIVVPQGQPVTFTVTTPQPTYTTRAEISWLAAGGIQVGYGNTFTLNTNTLSPGGTYNVEVRVKDPTSFVRLRDPNPRHDNPLYRNRSWTVKITAPTSPRSAAFVSQSSIPTTMTTGQSYPVSITMQNTGTETWTAAGGFKLGSQNPQDNTYWGGNRVNMTDGVSVPQGSTYTFSFTITAPSTPGTYNLQTKMLKEGVEWFGATSTNVAVNVTGSSPPPPSGASGSIWADPNPITGVCDGAVYGVTTIHWNSAGATNVEVRVNSPTGGVLATGTSGSATTGEWVSNGTVFYLVDASTGQIINTVTVWVTC